MLDVSIRLGILNLLQDLRDRLHLAILYITHDIASARYFADRTMVMYAGRIVESGDSESVTQDPKHPYTQLLVRSAPDPDDLEARAHGARGEAPSLVRPPSGCRFNPRCPFATDLCRTEVPPLMSVGEDREAACWGYSDRPTARRWARCSTPFGDAPADRPRRPLADGGGRDEVLPAPVHVLRDHLLGGGHDQLPHPAPPAGRPGERAHREEPGPHRPRRRPRRCAPCSASTRTCRSGSSTSTTGG